MKLYFMFKDDTAKVRTPPPPPKKNIKNYIYLITVRSYSSRATSASLFASIKHGIET